MRLIFQKTGDARFMSHLDLLRVFQRASRRSGLPVTMTKGFSPHLKISITKALKLGIEGIDQEAVFGVDSDTPPDIFVDRLNRSLPDGVRATRAERI